MIVIMAHPDRADAANTLARELSADIMWDQGSGENDTGDRAWARAADSTDQWATVIQDDALPVDGFVEHTTAALNTIPTRAAVSWYLGTTRPPQYQNRIHRALDGIGDTTWLVADQLLHGVAVTLPTMLIRNMLPALQRSRKQYDFRIGEYLRRQRVPIYYPSLSLVDHDDTESLLGHQSTGPRKAHRLGIPEQWNTTTRRL